VQSHSAFKANIFLQDWLAAAVLILALGLTVRGLGQTFQELYSFRGDIYGSDGGEPQGSLIQGKDGNFYGTTYYGGAYSDPTNGNYGYGTVFKMTPQGAVTILASFDGTNGGGPSGALVEGSDGNFYGTTIGGPDADTYGTLFMVTPQGKLSMLNVFNGYNGASPMGDLVEGTDGYIYGTTETDTGCGSGTIFRVPLGSDPGQMQTFFSFCTNADSAGLNPSGGLIQASDRNFYGVTGLGYGTLFRVTPQGSLTTLPSFNGVTNTQPRFPCGRLVQASDGCLYGVAEDGFIFKVTPAGALTAFPFSYYAGTDTLNGGLVQANDGNFYGTTAYGGDGDSGTVFRMTPDGVITALFTNLRGGWNPYAGLVQGIDGNLYGTCGLGGSEGSGTIFRIVMPGPTLASVQTGNQLTFSWRTNYVGFALQSSSDPTSGNWTTCTNPPAIIGGQFVVTNPISGIAGYFRLKK